VTGYLYDSSTSTSNTFLYTGGNIVDISDAALFPNGSDGTGINASGQVCGYGWPNATDTHAFLYTGGKTVDLGTLGGTESVAEAISNAGEVVGQSANAANETHAFLYSNGKMQDLGFPSGDNSSSAIAISSNGLIVGELGSADGTSVAVYSNGAWTSVAGGSGVFPTGINSSGQVVGWTIIPGVYSGPKAKRRPSVSIGLVTVNGTLTNLNALIPAGSEFSIIMAEAINNSGQILCNAEINNEETHAVLLTPQ
jgi:probable HAF family extracellular repeat protein